MAHTSSFTPISGSPARALAAREYKHRNVIVASSVGTLIEMYDFFIFGSLAAVISPLFYPPGNGAFAYLAYLATFAIGLVVRPFGALFFGRIGDLVGRKNTFLVTLGIMGGATAGIGLLPTYATAGWFAPIILIAIRALQGLAIGGEYGGAAVYVAEHAPDRKRGFYTSFIQIAGQLSNFVSLAVILIVQNSLGQESFYNWGWRIPFLLSIPLVGISLHIRLRMKESDLFTAQERWSDFCAAAQRGFHQMGEPPTRADFALRRDRRCEHRRLHRVLVFLLHHAIKSESERGLGQLHRRPRAALQRTVLRSLRVSLGPDRAQEVNDGGLPARGAQLPSNLPRDAIGGRFQRGDRRFAEESGDGRDYAHAANARCERSLETRRDRASLHESRRPDWQSDRVEADPADFHPDDLVCDGLRAAGRLSGRSVSSQDQIHVIVLALSHRLRLLRRADAADRSFVGGANRQYLRRVVFSDHCGVHHLRRRLAAAAGYQAH